MTQPATTTISVRGEAQRTVSPDQAGLHAVVSRAAASTPAAAAAAREAVDDVTGRLGDLEGRVLTADSARAPLTWSVQSIQTHEEYDRRGHGPTGRQACDVMLAITARDFARLPEVVAALTARDDVRIDWVDWTVDDDNAEWALVRADAIQAALRKSDDYAAALGGPVLTVDQVADAGLLGGDASAGWDGPRAMRATAAAGAPEGVSLDPVPQVVRAVIDARFTASIGALPER